MSKVQLPVDTKARTYFVDEAGTKGRAGDTFVVAAVRTSDPGGLHRAVRAVRDRERFSKEIHFKDVTKRSLPVFQEVIDVASKYASFGVYVVDKREIDPWGDSPGWEGNLWASEQLLRRILSRHEVATVLLDEISAPAGFSYSDELRSRINDGFKTMRIASSIGLQSTSCDGLQVADLVASSALYYLTQTQATGIAEYLVNGTPKAQLARHVASALTIGGFEECMNPKVRVIYADEKHLTGVASTHTAMSN
ncbi:MAG TPA: DUF3800 domain-containing protein [Brachybacterium paraconglomeratum]|uniref:DUF3800 domain-containing protein n=1 Tax=Brachybacterium paraconglomeratum TaxID=173362 RepID=A0A921KRY8_9MICO|nr:DUF3800 domain-containing protein [Brachybacterium paraconglomeratum]